MTWLRVEIILAYVSRLNIRISLGCMSARKKAPVGYVSDERFGVRGKEECDLVRCCLDY